MSSTHSPSPVNLPRFVSVQDNSVSKQHADGFKFSLVSYNILAQFYVKCSRFPYSPPSCLEWNTRSQAILSVFKNLKADFLCLQEVDEYNFYKENMERNGYSSTYIQRSGEKLDGCGIFYKQKMGELLLTEIIDYNDLVDYIQEGRVLGVDIQFDKETTANEDPGSKNASKGTQDEDLNYPLVRLKRDCVGLFAVFKLNNPSQNVIIVANTHIYWDPDLADIKLAQAKYLLSRLARFKKLVSDKFECTPSVIIAGDFNSTPGDKVYQYLTSGNSSSSTMVDGCEDMLIHFCSVYAFTKGEPPFTNYTPGFTGTLDYILFSPSNNIQPVGFLELPEPESSDIIGGLPNSYHPSDHLPIGAEFVIS